MFVARNELHVWRARLDGEHWPAAERLPPNERERAAALRGETSRRWVAARWALREVLALYLEQEAAAIELVLGERGKPRLAEAGPLRFNLSHSGELALLAIAAEREVGVDVERVRPRGDLGRLTRRALAPAEAAAVEAAAPDARLATFHAAWTRREAIAKCLGTGLGAPLPEIAVAVAELEVGPSFAAAVAIEGDAVPSPRYFAASPGQSQTLAP
jgi:4'-phosphopantetheinyl transferase